MSDKDQEGAEKPDCEDTKVTSNSNSVPGDSVEPKQLPISIDLLGDGRIWYLL